MQLILLFLFIGVTAGIMLLLSDFPYKRQSFFLGASGALGGGIIATIIEQGIMGIPANSLLILVLVGSSMLFILKRILSHSTKF